MSVPALAPLSPLGALWSSKCVLCHSGSHRAAQTCWGICSCKVNVVY